MWVNILIVARYLSRHRSVMPIPFRTAFTIGFRTTSFFFSSSLAFAVPSASRDRAKFFRSSSRTMKILPDSRDSRTSITLSIIQLCFDWRIPP